MNVNSEKFVVSSGISGIETAALAIELSSQLGLVASLTQFKCTKYYFHEDLTDFFEDTQCFKSEIEWSKFSNFNNETFQPLRSWRE
jgi:hypothetical protein